MRPLIAAIVADSCGGCCGGLAKTLVVYPLDLATTRREAGSSGRGTCRGLGIALAGAPIYAAFFHSAYVACAAIGGDVGGSTGAALVSSVVGVPLECAKHRVQLGSSWREAVRSGTLYDGYLSTLARNLPYNVVSFTSFAYFVRVLPSWAAGLVAGLLTALVTHPLDVVNTRIQAARRFGGGARPSLVATVQDGVQTKSLFNGLLWRLLSFPPASLVFFSIFEPTRAFVLNQLVTSR